MSAAWCDYHHAAMDSHRRERPQPARFTKENNMNARFEHIRGRILRALPLALVAGAGLFASTAALAQHHRGWGGPRVGIYFGPAYPYYYPPSPYYYPPPMVVPAQPPVYIEQAPQIVAPAPSAAPQGQAYYFCAAANGYYPYVKECPGGWQQVAPQPAR
jgi:hypothetical protein